MIKVIKKGHPVFVKRLKISELDKKKCSNKFLSNNLDPNEEVYVKCLDNGDYDFRGNSGQYRIISISAPLYDEVNVEKGDWIRKLNFDTIGQHVCVQIQSLAVLPFKNQGTTLVINGYCQMLPKNIVKVTEEEAKEMNRLADSLSLSENEHDEITSCIREDNGEPKMKYWNEKKVLKKLFMMSMQYPEKNLQAYKCIHCDAFHIGKSKLLVNESN